MPASCKSNWQKEGNLWSLIIKWLIVIFNSIAKPMKSKSDDRFDQDEWITFFLFFRSHCQRGSVRGRVFIFNRINQDQLVVVSSLRTDQPGFFCVKVSSQITGNEVFNFISNFRRHWNKTRLIGVNWPGSGSGIWYDQID